MAWITVYDHTARLTGTDDGDGDANITLRTRVVAPTLVWANGTSCRVTLLLGTTCTTVTAGLAECWFGQNPGTPNGQSAGTQMSGDQVQVKFGGNAFHDISASLVILSDAFTLAQTWDNAKDYVLSYYMANSGSPAVSYDNASGDNGLISFGAITGNFASQSSDANLSLILHNAALLTKIEIDTSELALDGSGHNSTTGTSVAATLTTQNAGMVFATISPNGGPVTSVTSSHLTWHFKATAGTGANVIELWYATSAAPLTAETITANLTSSGHVAIDVFGVVNADTSTIFDGAANTGTTDPRTLSTTAANTFIIGTFREQTIGSPTAGSGFQQISGADFQLTEYKVVSSAQTSLSITQTTGVGDANGGIAIAVLKASSGTQTLTQTATFTNTNNFFAHVLATGPAPTVWFDPELIKNQWFDPELNLVYSWYDHEMDDPSLGALTQSTLFQNTNNFFTHVVSSVYALTHTTLFTNTNNFFAHNVAFQLAQTALFTNTNNFFTHVVSATYALTQTTLFTNTNNFFAHTVSSSYPLTQTTLFTNTNNFFAHTVLSTANIAPTALFINANNFFTHTVTPGTVALTQTTLFQNTNNFFTHIVSLGAIALTQTALFTNTNNFFAHTVAAGAAPLTQTTLFTNTNNFFTHTVTSTYLLTQTTLFSNAQNFFAHTITTSNTLTQTVLFTNTQNFFAHVVLATTALTQTTLFVNTNNFFTHTITTSYALTQTTLFSNAQNFFTHVVSAGAAPLVQTSLFVNTNNFFGATVAQDGVTPGAGIALNNPMIASVGAMTVR